jgi:uncharacterized protein (TIGR02147 family)
VIFEHANIPDYLSAMLVWHRDFTPGFSIRREVTRSGGISHTQVSRLGSGKRRLTRDLVEPLTRLLRMTGDERVYLDRWVKSDRTEVRRIAVPSKDDPVPDTKNRRKRGAQNHLLQDWLNVYVRDAVKLKGFKPDIMQIFRTLGGIASPQRIGRSLQFLLREGFLRRTLDGQIVQNDVLVTSSDGVPNAKIRAFHKQALAIARRNLDLLPIESRQEAALIMHLNPESVAELRQLLKEFYERLLQFADERPEENEGLYQVLINFTPISAAGTERTS